MKYHLLILKLSNDISHPFYDNFCDNLLFLASY